MDKKPILCLDFDGVCHSSGWKGVDIDPPVAGLFEFLEAASEVFTIQIFSSNRGTEAMIEWFNKWYSVYIFGNEYQLERSRRSFANCPNIEFVAEMTIDDRTFTTEKI